MKLYRVKNWSMLYENNRTRELKNMAWVPVPNSHDGDGYTALVCRADGAQLYGAWIVILQVASKCGNPAGGCDIPAGGCGARGTLVRDNGKPHDAASISRMTRFPEKIIQTALDVLCSADVGWLFCEEIPIKSQIPQEGAGMSQEGAAIPHPTDEEQKGMEQKGMEQKGTEFARVEKPSKKEIYHPDSRTALHWLNEKSGKHFREIDSNLKFISARLSEPGVDIEGVKKMIEHQCSLWKGDTDMQRFLRPETLFNATKFDGYYSDRDTPIQAKQTNGTARGIVPNHDDGF